MSEFKGTPGPWGRWEQGGLSICKDIGNGNLQEVAWVQDCSTVAEEEANADLIAAAPELLEALQECFSMTALFNRDTDAVWRSTRDKCQAAIAKALGHAQS